MAVLYPVIGQWFQRQDGEVFEVVAIDESEGTVEIQQYDGTIDEIDLDGWGDLMLVEASAPEDWTGSVDMDPDEANERNGAEIPNGYYDPWQFLDNS